MPKPDLATIGARLKKTRTDRDFTQQQLADKTGLSVRHIANVEKGDVNPSIEVLSTLVEALGVSYDFILNPADEPIEVEIQEIAGLYRSSPKEVRRLILACVRTMAYEAEKMFQE